MDYLHICAVMPADPNWFYSWNDVHLHIQKILYFGNFPLEFFVQNFGAKNFCGLWQPMKIKRTKRLLQINICALQPAS